MQATANGAQRARLVIVGNGMVGHHCVEQLIERGATAHFELHVFGQERQRAYDRVHLSEYFTGSCAETLALCAPDYYSRHGVHLHLGEAVLDIDRERRELVTAEGRLGYDQLILATGSYPFVPPIEGSSGNARLVYR
ncbi:MAG: FAD-dependent oxidoreductase, partial [Pseudomonas sp.]|nr:FAD-dependent oxidoreductase [Pseudomonas sp.]